MTLVSDSNCHETCSEKFHKLHAPAIGFPADTCTFTYVRLMIHDKKKRHGMFIILEEREDMKCL